MRESNISHGKKCIPWLDGLDTDLPRFDEGVPRNNLLDQGHGSPRSLDRWWRGLTCQTSLVVVKQPSVFHDRLRDRVQFFSESLERDFLTREEPMEEAEVRRGE